MVDVFKLVVGKERFITSFQANSWLHEDAGRDMMDRLCSSGAEEELSVDI